MIKDIKLKNSNKRYKLFLLNCKFFIKILNSMVANLNRINDSFDERKNMRFYFVIISKRYKFFFETLGDEDPNIFFIPWEHFFFFHKYKYLVAEQKKNNRFPIFFIPLNLFSDKFFLRFFFSTIRMKPTLILVKPSVFFKKIKILKQLPKRAVYLPLLQNSKHFLRDFLVFLKLVKHLLNF